MNNKFIVYVSLPCAIIACGYALRANSTEFTQKDNGYDSVVAYIVPADTAFRSRLSGSDIQDVACKVTGGMASANYIHNVVISSIV